MAISKQDQVVELVKAGVSTRVEIRESVGCTSGALASYLTGMRNAAKFTGASICPVEVDKEVDGEMKKVFTVMTFQESEDIKAERAANRTTSTSTKTPEERVEAAEKRMTKCETAVEKAVERAEKDADNVELELRADKAKIDVKLAEIELNRAKALIVEDEDNAEVPQDDELM